MSLASKCGSSVSYRILSSTQYSNKSLAFRERVIIQEVVKTDWSWRFRNHNRFIASSVCLGMSDNNRSESQKTVQLTQQEKTVVRDAVQHYIENYAEDDEKQNLAKSLARLDKESALPLIPDADQVFEEAFRKFAQDLQSELAEGEGSGTLEDFFENAFKSVIMKLNDEKNGF